ncbi:hypothetical protein FCR2A7T_07360 [Flavobacterium cauense R2A-7]|nr:hypothetical protein FCR2A7T_07360 [Flavobacterium cauense R2A-7]
MQLIKNKRIIKVIWIFISVFYNCYEVPWFFKFEVFAVVANKYIES